MRKSVLAFSLLAAFTLAVPALAQPTITGEKKELHVIDHDACISCGACLDVCPTDSIRTFPKVELAAKEVV